MQLFCDLDGVLADFDGHYEATFGVRLDKKGGNNHVWPNLSRSKDFYLGIPLMPDANMIWARIEHHRPIILTGIPRVTTVPEAADNKKEWVRRYISSEAKVICCMSYEKCLHAEPGDVLIDDRIKYKKRWEDAGGVWIAHISAVETVRVLDGMGL
jgi:hypothetical protein